nr:MAG TPA: hypothetical protein [Caudoviricetes sp.]
MLGLLGSQGKLSKSSSELLGQFLKFCTRSLRPCFL